MKWFNAQRDLKETLEQAVTVALRRAREEWFKLSDASSELLKTRQEIEQLKIERDRITESHERQKREIEHKIGLERTRQEQELALGKREAVIAVREQNLNAEREQFEKQMRFTQERFEEQFASLRRTA